MSALKVKLYQQCCAFVNDRLQSVKKNINEIEQSLLSETKSSAGDKHETGRAMLQLEREKAGRQLAEVQKLNEVLARIDASKTSSIIALGSIVYTSKANYFIAVSAGQLNIGDTLFYAISSNTPIGKLLLSKKEGDKIEFIDESFIIKSIA